MENNIIIKFWTSNFTEALRIKSFPNFEIWEFIMWNKNTQIFTYFYFHEITNKIFVGRKKILEIFRKYLRKYATFLEIMYNFYTFLFSCFKSCKMNILSKYFHSWFERRNLCSRTIPEIIKNQPRKSEITRRKVI